MMHARRLKFWSWSDYRYPMGLAAVLMALTALIGVVGLFASNNDRGSQIVDLTTDSSCRAGIATKVDVALLDAFDFVLKMPARGTAEQAAERARLLKDIEDARAERAATSVRCNATSTTPAHPVSIPAAPTTTP